MYKTDTFYKAGKCYKFQTMTMCDIMNTTAVFVGYWVVSFEQSIVVIVKFRPDFISISIYFQHAGFAIALESFNQQQEEFEEEELLFMSKWLFASPTCANSSVSWQRWYWWKVTEWLS